MLEALTCALSLEAFLVRPMPKQFLGSSDSEPRTAGLLLLYDAADLSAVLSWANISGFGRGC